MEIESVRKSDQQSSVVLGSEQPWGKVRGGGSSGLAACLHSCRQHQRRLGTRGIGKRGVAAAGGRNAGKDGSDVGSLQMDTQPWQSWATAVLSSIRTF